MDEKVKRINELYKKSKETGLTDEERKEQQQLREEYARSFREGLKRTLENAYVLDENGKEVKLGGQSAFPSVFFSRLQVYRLFHPLRLLQCFRGHQDQKHESEYGYPCKARLLWNPLRPNRGSKHRYKKFYRI